MKELIVYFSLNEHVKNYAETLEGDKIEIQTEKPLIKNQALQMFFLGMGYNKVFDKGIPIQDVDVDVNSYDTITYVFPVWGGGLALPMKTFLEQFPITNKKVKVIAFCNGVEGIVFSEFEKLIDDSNTILAKEVIKITE